ncbi:MAG: glycosyltransferase family 4 protein, partial [Candidatus Omnitrophota bacterium]
MKILFVVSGTARVAASRYRVYQYLPYLSSAGVDFRVVSILSDFLTMLSIRSPEFMSVTRLVYYLALFIERFFRFWMVFFMAASYDVVFLQRAIFPAGLGKLLKVRNRSIVFDIDDAIFLPDTQDRGVITRFKAFVKEREVQDSLRVSKSVIVENDYIGRYVSGYCANVHKIPGPIDTDRYFVKPKTAAAGVITIGWIGSPATTAYLHILDNAFRALLERFPELRIALIGAGNYDLGTDRIIKKPWAYDTEVDLLQGFDIGIMPMPDDEWTKGKLGCKMLQYMAVGVVSVVSYTSTNAEVIKDGVNGFMVKTEIEWIERLSDLVKDPDARARIGAE